MEMPVADGAVLELFTVHKKGDGIVPHGILKTRERLVSSWVLFPKQEIN